MHGRILLVLTLGVLGFGTLTSTAAAATPSTVFQPFATPNPEPQPGGRWGERLVVANDENGDGVKDIFTSTPSADGQYVDQGRVYLLSGKDRSILRTIDSPEPQGGTAFGFSATAGAKFGFYISVPGDLDGDGKDDVVVGTDQQNVYTGTGTPCGAMEPNGCNEGQGKAWAFSGATSRVLHVFNNPDPQGTPNNNARFGSRIGVAGDVTNDGINDIIIGASNNDVPAGCGDVAVAPGCFKNEGQAYIFNGATGALVPQGRLGLPPGDRVGASCGVTPAPFPPGNSPCGTFGLSVQSPGDTTGDGVPEQLVDAANYSPPGGPSGVGRMYLFDGKTGGLLLRINDPIPQADATFGFQDAAPNSPGDVNGDGTPDLYAHGFEQTGPTGLVNQGRAWVFSGKDGSLIYTLDDPTPTTGGTFGFSMSSTDYNKDGKPDLYIGQAPHGAGDDQNGGTYVFDGRDASLLKALELPAADLQPKLPGDGGPSLGFSSVSPGDLNGDGEPDYLAGAPFFNENGVINAGRIYAFMSPGPVATPPATPGVTPPTTTPPRTIVVPIQPSRVKVVVTAKVTPRRDRRAPYRFTVTGRVRRPVGIRASTCKGGRISAQWKVKVSGKTVSTRRVTLKSDCSYRIRVTFRHRSRLGSGKLKVKVRFLGTARLKPASANALSARAG